jgi:hypothetical protein
MKTFEEYALTFTRTTLFYVVGKPYELLSEDTEEEEVDVDCLIGVLQSIQTQHKKRNLVLNTYDGMVGYYDQEPMKEFETRLKRAYETYVYGETQTMKAKMTQEELKAFEIKELEDKLAKLKDNA